MDIKCFWQRVYLVSKFHALKGCLFQYSTQKAAAAARRKKEKQIADIEAAIAKLEQEQQEMEMLLTDVAHQTSENFQRYEHIKHEMEQRLYEWEILSEE